ncbi:MAG: alpha/beta fold hydrolase [Marmoricola sp.]
MRSTGVSVGDGVLEVLDLGAGEPALFIQTGLTADELLPLAADQALDSYRRLVLHRRGYAGSSPAVHPSSIAREAADCVAVLDSLGLAQVQVVGFSYSGAVALQLAADRPDRVAGLTLIESPPTQTTYRDEFVAVVNDLLAIRRKDGVAAALNATLDMLGTPEWWAALDPHVPDAREQMRADAATFFDGDLPALVAWEPDDLATRITCPVMYVGGDGSGPWWEAARAQVLEWFPTSESVVIAGADHGLAAIHATEVAVALRRFWNR